MASKITMFEPHVDGPLFGSEQCDCQCGQDAMDAADAATDVDTAEAATDDTGCCQAKSIGLAAIGVVTVVVLAVTVRRVVSTTEESVPITSSD